MAGRGEEPIDLPEKLEDYAVVHLRELTAAFATTLTFVPVAEFAQYATILRVKEGSGNSTPAVFCTQLNNMTGI